MLRKFLILSAVCCALSACSTGYQEEGLTGGFTDSQLSENIFTISFLGNAFTSPQQAGDFVMLRAADLTLSHDYKYFVIDDQGDASTRGFIGSYGGGSIGGGELYYPQKTMRISCYKAKGTDRQVYFDAAFLQSSIKTKYKIK